MIIGALEHWSIGALEHWSISSLVHLIIYRQSVADDDLSYPNVQHTKMPKLKSFAHVKSVFLVGS